MFLILFTKRQWTISQWLLWNCPQKSDAIVHLSTVEGNRGKAPEYKGKLDSLVGDVEGFAFLQDRGLVQKQLEEESK